MFRNTKLDDESHIDFSRRIGDLDTVKRYMIEGRRPRFGHYELFDAGNVDDQGNVIDPDSPRAHYGKVRLVFFTPLMIADRLERATHYSTLTRRSTLEEQASRYFALSQYHLLGMEGTPTLRTPGQLGMNSTPTFRRSCLRRTTLSTTRSPIRAN
jgi:hypothetical protein